MSIPAFPFSAIVGHDDLRLALLLNAVQPGIGGVLVRGEKGTAKSTAVRALAALLPRPDVVRGCRFRCDPQAPDPLCPDGPHRASADPEHHHRRGPVDELEPSVPRPPLAVTVPASLLVELPLGATEDRLVGSLDLQKALSEGVSAYRPGLLAEANRAVLYVDEVNLLPDHLVDLLLDAAAMGRVHVERDGVSVSHAARFLLVGTMNPEEGELRPQLLDRFGLAVEVRASREVDVRVEVVRRRLAFEDDPAGFAAAWARPEAATAARIAGARERLGSVALPDAELRRIAAVCAAFDVDGMRADLVIARAAVAHAAWRGSSAVAEQDVRAAARLALPHRGRRDPFDEPGMDEQALDEALRRAAEQVPPGDAEGSGENSPDDRGPGPSGPDDSGPDPSGPDGNAPDGRGPDRRGSDGPNPEGVGTEGRGSDSWMPGGGGPNGSDPEWGAANGGGPAAHPGVPDPARANGPVDRTYCPNGPLAQVGEGASVLLRARVFRVPGVGEGAPGRRSRARTDSGRVVRASWSSPRRAADVHLPSTVAAAAPHQRARGRTGTRLLLRPDDLRHAVREGREGNLVLFAVDASGSMAARSRTAAVTGAVLALLRDAYQRRDKVGLISFRAGGAELVLPPTSSVLAATVRLAGLRTGGRTPLADGLLRARAVLTVERLRDPRRRALLVVLTDGRATVPAGGGRVVGAAGGGRVVGAAGGGRVVGRDPVHDACRAAGLLAADGVAVVVVDCESGPVRLGLAARLAVAGGGQLVGLDELSADRVADVVRAARAS